MEWVRGYTGLTGFLKYHHLEWLFALCLLTAFGGVLLLALPRIRRNTEKNPILRSNLELLAIAGQAGSLYGCAQSLWWLNQGLEHYRGPVWLYLALTLACSVWMAANLRREQDPRQRRKNSLIELGYCAAQGGGGRFDGGHGAGPGGAGAGRHPACDLSFGGEPQVYGPEVHPKREKTVKDTGPVSGPCLYRCCQPSR